MEHTFWIYAATTGQCIARNASDVDEKQRNRVLRDFESGVRFVLDSEFDEIRGFIPALRTSQEAFVGVVRADDSNTTPFATYVSAVKQEFDRRDRWSIREDTAEGRMFDRLGSNQSVYTLPTIQHDRIVTARENRPAIKLAAPSLTRAVDVSKEVIRLVESDSETTPTVVIATADSVEHVQYDLLVTVRNDMSGVVVLSGNDRGAVESRGDTKTGSAASLGIIDRLLQRIFQK